MKQPWSGVSEKITSLRFQYTRAVDGTVNGSKEPAIVDASGGTAAVRPAGGVLSRFPQTFIQNPRAPGTVWPIFVGAAQPAGFSAAI